MAEGKLKENARGNVYSDKFVVFPPGRAYFVKLARPDPKFNKYQLNVLYDKTDKVAIARLKELKAEFQRLVDFKYTKQGKKVPATLTVPAIRDGDTATNKEGELLCLKYKEYKGKYFLSIGNKDPIRCIEGAKETIKDIDPVLIANGVIVDGTMQALLYDDGCSWQGKVVRRVKDDGVRYNTGPDSAALLGALEADDVTAEQAADDALGASAGAEVETEEVVEEVAPAVVKVTKAKVGKAAAADIL